MRTCRSPSSSAPTAVTVRATVRRLIDQGQSDQQIKDYLVARYGSAIVLDPPASGWSALVWVLPVVGRPGRRGASWWWSWPVAAGAGAPTSTPTCGVRRPTRWPRRSGAASSPSHWPTPTPSTWPATWPTPTTWPCANGTWPGWPRSDRPAPAAPSAASAVRRRPSTTATATLDEARPDAERRTRRPMPAPDRRGPEQVVPHRGHRLLRRRPGRGRADRSRPAGCRARRPPVR